MFEYLNLSVCFYFLRASLFHHNFLATSEQKNTKAASNAVYYIFLAYSKTQTAHELKIGGLGSNVPSVHKPGKKT